jgi:hypothetical protein
MQRTQKIAVQPTSLIEPRDPYRLQSLDRALAVLAASLKSAAA